MAGIARKSRAQRFPVFALSFHGCVGRFRALASFHRLSIDARSGAIVAGFASSAILARVGRGTRAFLAGPVRIARGNVRRRFVFVSPGLHPRRVVASTSDGDTSSATRLMENKREKLEDLARLALKRLNISYLTISSRLVWFERETFVCVANANDEGNDARDSRSRRGS